MKKPNILFLLSDDHGSWATGCYNNQEVITPNIDKLATTGITFDNFFCTAPVCSPARASIFTGQMPSTHGVHDWINGGNLSRDEVANATYSKEAYAKIFNNDNYMTSDKQKKNPFYHGLFKNGVKYEHDVIDYLADLTTFTELLAKNGYTCAMSGKWHLGATTTPHRGFKYWKPISKGGTHYIYPEIINDDKDIVVTDDYVTTYIADNAIKFLDEYKDDDPFYLSVHFTAPHSPWGKNDHPQEVWDMYEDCQFNTLQTHELHPNSVPTAPRPTDGKEQAIDLMRGYFSAVTAMDIEIGRIIEKLKATGEYENTIIIYCSDNGINIGQHGVWGKGNGTFPLNFYEESIKVPFIFNYPKLNQRATRCDELLSQYDIFPTIVDICNIDYTSKINAPGRSFKRILENQPLEQKPIVVFDEYGPNRMIRTKDCKFVIHYHEEQNEFYDLINDPHERTNAIDDPKFKDVIEQLKNELTEWFNTYSTKQNDGKDVTACGLGQYNTLSGDKMPFVQQ